MLLPNHLSPSLLSSNTPALSESNVAHSLAMSEATRQKSTIFVGGLAPTVTSSTLHSFFEPFGEISDISLPKPDSRPSNNSSVPSFSSAPPATHKGFGYIEFALPDDAADAIDNMDQAELFGRVIKVAAAKPNQRIREGEGEGGLGSRTALWEQEGYLTRHGEGNGQEVAAGQIEDGGDGVAEDPMQGLEGLDVAGPRGA